MTVRTFSLAPSIAWLIRLGPWLFALLALSCLGLPWVPDPSPRPVAPWAYAIDVGMALFFGTAAFFLADAAKRLPLTNVSVDEDGIWPASLAKASALTSWRAVRELRERPVLQRLELLGEDDRPLVLLEYQLNDFAALRQIVMERTRSYRRVPPPLATMGKRVSHHVVTLSIFVVFLGLFLYVGRIRPLLGYVAGGPLLFFMLQEYLTTAYRVTIVGDDLEIAYPRRCIRISRAEIRAIEYVDASSRNRRTPEVLVIRKNNSKPIQLSGFVGGSIAVCERLNTWLVGSKPDRFLRSSRP